MVTRIENMDGQGSVYLLPDDASIDIRTDHLYHLKRPGLYEITNVLDEATAIQEHATPVKEDKFTPGVKPEILADDQTMNIPVVRGREAFTVTIVNFTGPDTLPEDSLS